MKIMIKNKYKKLKKILTRRKAKKMYNTLFQNYCGIHLSKHDRTTVVKDDISLIYGEIVFDSFIQLLDLAKIQKNEIFYDLGSGLGKAVIVAALTQPFSKCVGLELLPSLYKASQEILQKLNSDYLKPLPIIEFKQTDLFTFDIEEANVVFINATGFFGESFQQLITKLETLKSNSRIIITSKLLNTPKFLLLNQNFYPMSWGYARVSVYKVT